MSDPNRKECSYSEKPNSSDTISRRKAFEYFVTLWECIGTIMDRDEWEDVCMTTANEIPSAQPEIIRCKDCKYYVLRALFGRSYGLCERLCDEFDSSSAMFTEGDDFCSHAERRKQ